MRSPLWLACLALAACAGPAPSGGTRFDPCEPVALVPQGGSASERASLGEAVAMWNGLGGTSFYVSAQPAPTMVPVVFQAAAPQFHGYYDPAQGVIYINSGLDDEHARAVTMAHEMGHALGLVHVPPAVRPSVMNPANLTVQPTAADEATVESLWGACPPGPARLE